MKVLPMSPLQKEGDLFTVTYQNKSSSNDIDLEGLKRRLATPSIWFLGYWGLEALHTIECQQERIRTLEREARELQAEVREVARGFRAMINRNCE